MAAAPNMEKFEAYFVRADLDRDGRISGQEAVSFFQGSNLPKQTLAQIWMHADQNRTGFLGRAEFYNALRLVTVAQSGRELTADIVKAALYGPAAAKIPAPQINPAMAPAVQMNPAGIRAPQINPAVASATQMSPAIVPAPQSKSVAPPSTQMGQISTAPASSQSPAFQGPQAFPSMGANQQFFSTDNLRMRQSQPGASVASMQGQVASQVGSTVAGQLLPGSNTANLSTNWLGGSSGSSVGGPSQLQIRGNAPSVNQDGFGPLPVTTPGMTPKVTPPVQTSSIPPKPQDLLQSSFQPTSKDSKASVSSGNGFPSDSLFGGDGFSAMPQTKKDAFNAAFSSIGMPNPSGSTLVASGSQNSIKAGQLNPLQRASVAPSGGSQLPQTQAIVKPNQFNIMQSTALNTSNVSVGQLSSVSNESQQAWPKITQSDVQKYTRVFVEVDKDRDGKITGEQARNLFLSWRLPREILKQVWDLSDQDNDSTLSLREFCTALYLMERYREGRTLPSTLPNSLKYDDTLLRATGQPSLSYGGPTIQPSPGLSQQGMPGSHPVFPTSGLRPPLQNSVSSQIDQRQQPHQNLSRMVANQHFKEKGALDANSQEPAIADKKVPELEKEILDSKEKIEFYRNKMQELVLYKSRCDNRLNEITERASADKREVESLAKKYEEKYKQVGDVASKLTVEEARYRDIQERKMELHNAIIKVEQGGSADGLLQVRADRIQSDLEELEKALNERCKQHGVDVKPTTTIKLPFGWQPGVQEGAMDWDEDWDKFEDEGFTLENEVNSELENGVANPKPKSPAEWDAATDEVSSVASSRYTNGKVDILSRAGEPIIDESVHAQSEGSTWSPHGSPGRSALGSPSREFHSTFSQHTKESSSEHLGAESTVSGDKFFDEPSWGATFDANDDVDSVWGFNSTTTKDIDHERTGQSSFFGPRDFGLNPINVSSPSASSVAGKEKSSIFADSVPSTPLFNSSSPPGFNERRDDHSFDSFSRFDSFNMNDSGFFSQRETLTRFDSISSTRDSEHNRGFSSFDDADPFGSSGPFKSSESRSPKRDSGSWNAF